MNLDLHLPHSLNQLLLFLLSLLGEAQALLLQVVLVVSQDLDLLLPHLLVLLVLLLHCLDVKGEFLLSDQSVL